MSGCTNLLSNLVANNTERTVRTREITIENNLTNFSNAIKSVLSCAQKIIPSQGEVVIFEKPNFDSSGKVYFYKINADNSKATTNYNNPVSFRSIIVGPFTTFIIRGDEKQGIFPKSEHKADEKLEYYAQVKETPTQILSQIPNKIFELDNVAKFSSCTISMSDCYTLCDDTALQGSNMCLSGFRQCVKAKTATAETSILNTQFLIECSRKYMICQKYGGTSFPFSTNYDKDYSKMCNPDPKKNYQPYDDSCKFVNKNTTPLVPIKNDPFYNLYYYGTFFDLCSSSACLSYCSDKNWQEAWSKINLLNNNINDQTVRVNKVQSEIIQLKQNYLEKKKNNESIISSAQSNLSSYQQEYNNFILNMSQLKEQVVKEINISLSTAKAQQEERVKDIKMKLEIEKNNDIINANSQFLIREEDYKNRMANLDRSIDQAMLEDKINREKTLNNYDKLQKDGALLIQNAQSSLEKSLNDKLNNFINQNTKDIQTINETHKSSLNSAITKATNEISRINTAIQNETQAFESFKNAIEDKMKAVKVAADQTDLLYEKEIDRLNGILQLNNDNNKKTIKDTQARYDEQISNLLKLSDAEKKIILQDKNTTVENKMDFLTGKQDLISQDFENKKSLLESQYEMAIAAQDNLYNTQLAELKKNNDKNINDLMNVAKNYKNTISETQTNLSTLQQNYNDKTIKLNNDIKIAQEEGVNNIKKLISDNEEAKIKLLVDAEKKTQMIMQELDDKLIEQQKLAIQSKAYYARELEKLLIESENKRIDLINNNTKELEATLTDLENNYKNRSKELDVKISQLKKERDIIQEESNVKLDNVNKIITKKEEYKTVYVKSLQKTYILGLLIIINIILLILKLKK
jgi:hypothetical protein